MYPKGSKTPKPKSLQVPDALSIEEFVTQAKNVWRKHHPENLKSKGRPSQMKRYLEIIWDLKKQGKFNDQTTQADICKLVLKVAEAELITKPELGFNGCLSAHDMKSLKELSAAKKRAIRKYVRFWKLYYQFGPEFLTDEDHAYIEKNLSKLISMWESVSDAIFKYGKSLTEAQLADALSHHDPSFLAEQGPPTHSIALDPQALRFIVPLLTGIQNEYSRLLPDNAPKGLGDRLPVFFPLPPS